MGNDTVARRGRHPDVANMREQRRDQMGALALKQIAMIAEHQDWANRKYYRVLGTAAVAKAIRAGATDAAGAPARTVAEAIDPTAIHLPDSSVASAWVRVGEYLLDSMQRAHLQLSSHE